KGLVVPDRQGRVLIGTMRQRLVDEQVPRRATNGFQYLEVADALLEQTLQQPLAGPLRGHADTALQQIITHLAVSSDRPASHGADQTLHSRSCRCATG